MLRAVSHYASVPPGPTHLNFNYPGLSESNPKPLVAVLKRGGGGVSSRRLCAAPHTGFSVDQSGRSPLRARSTTVR